MTTELADALRRREPAAFTHLLAEHGSMLYRLARRLTGHADDAEDVVQECLVTAYSKIDTLEDPAALGGWLRRIAVNAALMRIRSRGREPQPMPCGPEFTPDGRHARVIAGWALPPEDAVLRREALAVLRAAVDRLPDGARLVYVLTEIEGLSYADTADLLGISPGAVRVRLHRARTALRQTLAHYFAEWRDRSGDMSEPTAEEKAMTRDLEVGNSVTRSIDVSWPSAGRRWDTVVALLRIALGLVFVIPGLKGVVPALFGFAGRDALVAKFVNPTTGFLAPWLVDKVTSLGAGIGVVLLVQGLVEIAIGLALIFGAGTRMAAFGMAMMLMSFTVAAPTAGAIRLARDLTLAGLCMALILAGTGRWSLDRRIAKARGFTTLAGADTQWRRRLWHRLLGDAALPARRRDDALLAIRLGLAFPMLTSVAFTGGIFDNPLNTTLPLPLVGTLGVLLAAGLASRFVMAPVALWMLALIFSSLTTKGLFAGLDDGKREIGLLAAAIAYLVAGPDRWSWPHPARLRCREASELLLSYVDGTLETKPRHVLEEHFADCPDCWRYLGTYRQTVTLGQQLRDESMPAEVYERLVQSIRAVGRPKG